jgi:hypothetical protein
MIYRRNISSWAMALLICGSAGAANNQPGNYKIVDLGFRQDLCGPTHAFFVDANGTRIDMGSLFGFGTWGTT